MTKTEYMNELSKRLRPLPKEDFERAIEYFEEYFADGGIENEAQVIEDLGSPEFAARQLITNIALNNSKEPAPNIRKGINAIWIGILAVCAAPIALPLAFALLLVIVAFLFTIVLLLGSLWLLGASCVLASPVYLFAGFTFLSQSIPVFISCLGSCLLFMGLGLLVCFFTWRLCKRLITAIIHLFGHIIRGGKMHAKNN